MRRFEFREGASSQFWEIEIVSDSLTVRFGKVGSTPQTQTKSFVSPVIAQVEHDRLVQEKLAQGYLEKTISKVLLPRTPSAPRIESAAPTSSNTPPPTLRSDHDAPRVVWNESARKKVLPRRTVGPRPTKTQVDEKKLFAKIVEAYQKTDEQYWRPADAKAGEPERAIVQSLREGMLSGAIANRPLVSDEQAALAVILWVVNGFFFHDAMHESLVEWWIALEGIPFALETLARAPRFARTGAQNKWNTGIEAPYWLVPSNDLRDATLERGDPSAWVVLRRRIAAADDEAYVAARSTARKLRPNAPLSLRIALSFSFPDETTWSVIDAQEVELESSQGRAPVTLSIPLLASLRDAATVTKIVQTAATNVEHSAYSHAPVLDLVFAMVDGIGLEAAKPLQILLERASSPGARRILAEALSLIESIDAANAFAKNLEDKDVRTFASEYFVRAPRLAVRSLAPLSVSRGKSSEIASSMLGAVLRTDPDVLDSLSPLLGAEERAAVEAIRKRVAIPSLEASFDEQPRALRTRRDAKWKTPTFWVPEALPRPLLRGREKALSIDAMNALGWLLAGPPDGDAIAELRAAMDVSSLQDFAWALFEAWLFAGAPSKEAWAFTALGHLGGDDAARRLTPLIRAWPGESAHARAVVGLDVLATIGTDVALMHLHGIAQKLKFKALQERARQKIAGIAKARGLGPDDLADRLVPDFDLDEKGSRVLDFGERKFRVGFDEQLHPFVRDESGKRLNELPKPNKGDDAEKAEASVATWKALKKNVRAIASAQVARLELAMCARRRWDTRTFRMFLVDHPLVTHLVRRLAWGVYAKDDRLLATFRLAEDGTFADATDAPFVLGEDARVGIPHAIELEETAQKWGQIFADYEILQPFVQLGRGVFRPTEAERRAKTLDRVRGLKVPVGAVLGLDARGWRRGPPEDAGVIHTHEKALSSGRTIELELDPGIWAGMVVETPEQTLGLVVLRGDGDPTFGDLDPVTFSELVSDLMALRR